MIFKQEDIEKALYYIRALHLPDDFGIADDEAVQSLDIDYLARDLAAVRCPSFRIFHGVSKAVINIQELPFVIKIPFNGMWYYDYTVDDDETNYFVEFQYAGEKSNDYCWLEKSLSEEATEAGFGALVPEIMYVGEFNGHNFYLQEKVVPFDEESQPLSHSSRESQEAVKQLSYDYRVCSPAWIAAIIESYGESYWKHFVDWGNSEGFGILEDMHARNYGFRCDGRPVIFDIGGFSD